MDTLIGPKSMHYVFSNVALENEENELLKNNECLRKRQVVYVVYIGE